MIINKFAEISGLKLNKKTKTKAIWIASQSKIKGAFLWENPRLDFLIPKNPKMDFAFLL